MGSSGVCRRWPAVAAALAALALSSCATGAGAPGETGRLEESVETQLGRAIGEEGPFSQVLQVLCAGRRGAYECSADIAAGGTVFRERYSVRLGGDGCWRASLTSFEHLRGPSLGPDEQPPASKLKGCLR
jgi:hypothetical protein